MSRSMTGATIATENSGKLRSYDQNLSILFGYANPRTNKLIQEKTCSVDKLLEMIPNLLFTWNASSDKDSSKAYKRKIKLPVDEAVSKLP